MKKHPFLSGYFLALIATAIWAGNLIIARHLYATITPVNLAFWRWLVAVILLAPFALKASIKQWQIIKKNLKYLSIIGFLGVTVLNTIIYLAGHSTSALNLSLISITFPVFIIFLNGILFRERISAKKILGVLLAISGVLLLIMQGDLKLLLQLKFSRGDLWMILSSFLFALYSVLIRFKPEKLTNVSFQFSTFVLGLIFLLPFYIFESFSKPTLIFNRSIILAILYVGVFASLIGYLCWNKAVEIIGATSAGMVYYSLPLFSGVMAFFLLQEPVNSNHLYSALLIASGIVIAQSEKKQTDNTYSTITT